MTAAMPLGLWLNDCLVPTDAVCLPLAPQWSEQVEVSGEWLARHAVKVVV